MISLEFIPTFPKVLKTFSKCVWKLNPIINTNNKIIIIKTLRTFTIFFKRFDFLKKDNNINALYEKIPAHDLGINKHKNAITKKK